MIASGEMMLRNDNRRVRNILTIGDGNVLIYRAMGLDLRACLFVPGMSVVRDHCNDIQRKADTLMWMEYVSS